MSLRPDTGTVTIARTATIGILAQEVSLDPNPTVEHLYTMTVGAEIAERTPCPVSDSWPRVTCSVPVGSLSIGQ